MSLKAKILYKVFQRMSKGCYGPDSGDVSTWQETFLQREMVHQKTTYYGRKYGFTSIRSIEDYQCQVPLTKFDDYQPYFERLKQGAADLLFNDRIIAWLLTSGTTSVPKMVPLTQRMEHQLSKAPLNVYLSYIADNPRENLRCLSGKFLSVMADPEVERVNGIPAGYLSGVVFALKAQSRFSASMFTPSLDVLLERDWNRKYWQISQQATQQNVSIITGVPVYIVDYLSQLELDHKHKLGLGAKSISEIWPNLKLVVWGGATLDSYRTRLTALLGDQVDYWETYGATEPGLIAYQVDREPGMVPALDMVFLEFIPLTEWRAMEAEGGEYQTFEFTYHTLQDVKPGVNYVIVMTTLGGMYRYIIGDTVVFQSTNPPRLSWSGRLVWYSNITLERMNYGHVEQMIHLLGETFGCLISNFSYASSYDPPRYHFIIEPDQHTDYSGDLAASIDQYLMEVNAEYQFCRERQFLQTPKATLVPPGTYGRLEQLKIREKTNKLGHFKSPRFTNLQTLKLLTSLAT